MRGTDRIAGQPDCAHDAATYALGALEPAEARAFARHAERCAICRDEIAALAQVLDALPGSAPARRAPRAVRRRVLRAARAEPKPGAVRRPGRIRLLVPSTKAAGLTLGVAVAVALLVQLGSTLSRRRVIPAAVGQAHVRVTGGRGELVVDHLAALPADRTYELWLVRPGHRPVPSTLFGVTTRGTADIGVPADLHGLTQLLVTVERRGGSVVPTRRAVIQIDFARVPPPRNPP